MKNVFIDTNIWLSLYHFTNDDLSQFEKLKDMLNTSINLIVPQQVSNEILRNRESKIKDALKSFDMTKPKYPVFCKAYEEFEQLNKDITTVVNRFKEFRKNIESQIISNELPADKTLSSFFSVIEIIPSDIYIEKAYNRYRIGNPPGKDNKYGDAINWECLLDKVTPNEDLYFISADKDYHSLVDDQKMNPFLVKEWSTKKNSKIYFYSSLVDFLKEHVRDIQLEDEIKKQKLILDLCNSQNFVTTHGVIASLKKYSGWTEQEVEQLSTALINNNQINWIITDSDVWDFYFTLLSNFNYEKLPDCATKRALELLAETRYEEEKRDYLDDIADVLESR
ncbi:PIN domain-containing protein [uncultured Veillonella sp.]|uniref:PIN domain-containing protein n=1 Tax=uncultured Veillonella sp. TaxID=159268 RepID=UPI002805735F|nr:PIN domain-containing protein [uncultured Veillonella sp.]